MTLFKPFFAVDFRAIEKKLLRFLGRTPAPGIMNLGFSTGAVMGADMVLQLHKDGTYEVLKDRVGNGNSFDGAILVRGSSTLLMGTVTGRLSVHEPELQVTLCEDSLPLAPVKDFMEVGDSVSFQGEHFTVKKIITPRSIVLSLGGVLTFVFTTRLSTHISWGRTSGEWLITGGGVLVEVREQRPYTGTEHVASDEVGYVVHPDEDNDD